MTIYNQDETPETETKNEDDEEKSEDEKLETEIGEETDKFDDGESFANA